MDPVGAADPTAEAGDRLCRLAARLLDAPAAILSLPDGQRPVLAGRHGIPPSDWSERSPLFAALAGLEGDSLRVEDVGGHELLREDPLHLDLGISSFLAVPVPAMEGGAGSLCVLSREPRHWTPEDLRDLEEVAAATAAQILLRRRLGRDGSASQATWRSFVDLVDGIDAIVNERDPRTDRFLFVSRRAEELLGHSTERWTRETGFFENVLLHPDDKERVLAEIAAAVENRRNADLTYRVLTADGRVVWIQDLVRPIERDGGGVFIRGVMVEVTRQKQSERELERKNQALLLLQELAVRANESRDAEGPFLVALHRICEHAGWPVGHLYRAVPGPGGETELSPTHLWHPEDPTAHAGFRAATGRVRFRRNEGLPGRVLASGLPEWISRLRRDENFPRADAAARAGFASAFAFPVLAGRDVAAVLEFFTDTPSEPDGALMELSAHVGAILGRVVERERAEAERERAERRTREILETANDAFISMDADGVVREWNDAARRTFGWTRAEALGRRLADLIIPEQLRERHTQGLARFLQTGEGPLIGQRVEVLGVRKDGSEVPVEIAISPMEGPNGWTFNAFLHDVGDRVQGEKERGRREGLLAETQRLARIGSWEWDVVSDRITWSDELHRIFGTDPETFAPSLEAYLQRLPPDDREKAEDLIGRSMGTREPFAFEHRVVGPDGETSWILSQGRAIADEEGEVARMVGTAQDITKRREADARERALAIEQAARAEAESAEERVRTILESISDAFFAMDRTWRLTYVNRATEELLGEPASRLVGQPLMEVFPDTPDGTFQTRYEEVVAEGRPAEFEAYHPAFDDWYEVRAFPSEDGLSVYLHDITDRKRAEERLKASEARYRFLADSIPQQIWTASPDGQLDYVNKVVVDFFGVGEDNLLGERWLERVHPDDAEEASARWADSVARGDPYEVEFRLRDAGGVHRWHLARAVAQRDPDGNVVKWFGTNTYVHDQKEAEQERDRAMEELERITHLLSSERTNLEAQARELRRTARALKKSNEDLDRFAYIASHDLKAPLRGIANLSAWLAEDLGEHLDPDSEEYIRLLQGRVHRMEALIDGILQYSRAGRTKEEPQEVDVGEMVREILDLLDPPAHFRVELGDWWPVIHSEPTPLRQVFLNLIGNALKHADGEAPVVRVEVSDEGEGWYEYGVMDNGPGIAPEYHEKIFTIFQTLKPRDEVESTGIGLSVVKRIIDNHGGQVWVESREGEGATFKFLWPMNPTVKEEDRWMM
ncbi:MAG: PAS domain S-box protein [Gemmatimonadetes bacterium]|nr:PAS domain S-box protein [Gemmatimonadota bacterium]